MLWVAVLLLGVVAGTVGGVVGFGASVILMPALVLAFGAKEAVPVMAVAALLANASRAAVWWREIDLKVAGVYSVTAIPAAWAGARTMLALDARLVEGVLGVFLILAVPGRRWLLSRGFRMPLPAMALLGAAIGFLAGIVAVTGPINTPFYLAYGLTKGAYLSTEAIGSAAVGLTKLATFRSFDALPAATLANGLIVGSSLMLGSWIAKQVVERMDGARFSRLLEALMIAAGLGMVWAAWEG